jgi:hypothetical protein
VKAIAETAGRVFDTLLQQRTTLIQGLQESIRTNNFDQWCGQKRELGEFTVLDDVRIRAEVAPDYYLEQVFGERPPIVPSQAISIRCRWRRISSTYRRPYPAPC